MKKQLPKYRMGVQEVDVNTADKKSVGSAAATGAMSGAAMGATLGSVVPGWGTAVGAVVGGAVGGITGGIKQSKTNKSIDKKTAFNDQAKAFNSQVDRTENAATYIDSRNTVMGAKVNRMDVAKNGKKSIAKGKLVEVEGGEAITHPNSTSIAKVVSGPSHAQGGVKMVLPKGVSIIPVKDTPAFVAGDTAKRNKIKDNLPADTNPRLYDGGTDKLTEDNTFSMNKYTKSQTGKQYGFNGGVKFNVEDYAGTKAGKQYDFSEPAVRPVQQTNPSLFSNESLGLNKPTKIDSTIPNMGGGRSTSVDKPTPSKPVVAVPGKVSTANTAGSIAGNVIALAPSIYNLGRGLTEKAATTQTQVTAPAYIDPKVDTTYQKALIEKQSNAATDAAATLGGGNAAMLSNRISSIQAGKIGALNELANDKYLAENENRKYNTTLQNDFSARKDAAFTYAKDADMQNVARKNDFIGASMTGVSDLYQSRENTKRQETAIANQNDAYLAALKSKDFKYDPKTGMQLNTPTIPTADTSVVGSSPMSSYSKSYSRKLLKRK